MVGALIGAWSYAKFFRRSAQTLLFMRYTERYEQIMGAFPENAQQFRFNMTGELPPRSAALTLAVLRHLNLHAEEYYLFRKGYIEPPVWGIWEVELQRMLASPLLVREWKELSNEFQSYSEFQRYVETLQKKNTPAPAIPTFEEKLLIAKSGSPRN